LHQRTFLHGTPRARATQIAAVLVALLTVRLVAGDLSALHRGARRYGGTRAVVIAVVDLELGARVRGGDVKTVELPAAAVPPATLTRRDDAIGRVVAVPVLAGAAVADRALAPQQRTGAGGVGAVGVTGLDGIVAPGRRAVRVTTIDGLRPDPGSVVDILATLDARDVGASVEPTVVVARAARVLTVDPAPSSRDTGTGPDARVGVVILVTALEASHIADATARGALMLALDPPEDACSDGAPVSCRP
jgi:Flp pilus assembly protein CpaB